MHIRVKVGSSYLRRMKRRDKESGLSLNCIEESGRPLKTVHFRECVKTFHHHFIKMTLERISVQFSRARLQILDSKVE